MKKYTTRAFEMLCMIAISLLPILYTGLAYSQITPSTEQETKTVSINRDQTPTIDGQLDEEAWESAAMINDLHQIRPIEYDSPTENTEIRIFYDDDALYIGAKLFDSQPETMNANTLRQGAHFWGDDYLSVIVAPFNDKRNGYRFQINPNGVRMEMLFYDTSGQDWNWNGIWYGAVSRNESGWVAEISIPFKTLSFNPQNDTWGINFTRDLGRISEMSGWVSRNSSQDPSIAGEAVGFEQLQLGKGIDIVPSVTLKEKKDFDISSNETNAEPSLDLFYKITPSLNGAVTLNTDFSATEVDTRQLELTRFSLFFPEKRTFFLRDADIFRYARVGGRLGFGLTGTSSFSQPDLENGRPYFSRRIGLGSAGQPVDIDAGAKLSGRVGRWNVGALAIRQDQYENIHASDIFVGRITANVLEESSAGILITDGDPRSNVGNSVGGFDFLYNNTRLPGGKSIQGEAWYQESRTDGINENQSAYGMRIRAPNVLGWRGGIGVKQIEENFFPALGFVNRAGIRDQTFELGYSRRVGGEFLRTVYSAVDAHRVDLISGGLQSQVVTLRALELESHLRDRGHLRFHSTKEVLTEPYVIWKKGSEKIIVPPDSYAFNETELSFSTGDFRRIWGSANYRTGDFYGGTRTRIGTSIGWRPSNHFQFRLNYDFNDVELPNGIFNTRLVGFRTDIIFSNKVSWLTLIQYDNVTETAGLNSRLHWIPEAGKEFFIVFNHNLQDMDLNNRFESTLSDLAIKLNYTFRF